MDEPRNPPPMTFLFNAAMPPPIPMFIPHDEPKRSKGKSRGKPGFKARKRKKKGKGSR